MVDPESVPVTENIAPAQRDALLRQGEMVLRSAHQSVTEQNDLDDIQSRFNRLPELISTLNRQSTT